MRTRWALTALTGMTVLAASACGRVEGVATGTAGTPTTTPITTSAGVTTSAPVTTSTDCTDWMIADPWIIFESSLQAPADTLAVGEKGWLDGPVEVEDVRVAGDTDAVEVSHQRVGTEFKCGKELSSRSWIQVDAMAPGTVTLVYDTYRGTVTLTLTITS